jgi:hypothetical protein
MSFAQTELPPILQEILTKLQNLEHQRGPGTLTADDFKQTLYSFRITDNDINDIKTWFRNKGIIHITKNFQKETIEIIKPYP